MRSIKSLVLFFAFVVLTFSAHAKTYDMKRLGANNKGTKSCTALINKTIQKASEKGGGTIYFPAGTYLTGAIEMADNITLYLEAGATLSFTTDFDEYLPFKKVRWEGIFMSTFKPLIYGDSLKNVAIKGEGVLEGNGEAWWEAVKQEQYKIWREGSLGELNKYQKMWGDQNIGLQVDAYYGKSMEHLFFRPPFLQFLESENIQIKGVTFRNSPFWTINPVGCENLLIDGITIDNPDDGWNTDGINPSSCKNVRIANCKISVGDDCVTIKSGRDGNGRDYGKACENITISNCIMLAGHGGVVIGSEMSGGVKNVTITGCVFDGTDAGIRLKSSRGRGGVVENIRVDNIIMRNIQKKAFIFNLYYDKDQTPERLSVRTPSFRNIHISNVTGVDVNVAGYLHGIEEMPVSNVSLSNIQMEAKRGFHCELGTDIEFHNVDIATEIGPSLVVKNCKTVVLDDVRTKEPHDGSSVIEVSDSENVFLNNAFPRVITPKYIKLDDKQFVKGGNNCLVNVKEEL
ncbi:MAG: glycoside hydrolase family 28 protein [Mangrovibacterium sp.]